MRELKFRVWDGKVFIKKSSDKRGEVLIDFDGKIRIAEYSQGNGDNSSEKEALILAYRV